MLRSIFESKDIFSKVETFNKEIEKENFWQNKYQAEKILKEKNSRNTDR